MFMPRRLARGRPVGNPKRRARSWKNGVAGTAAPPSPFFQTLARCRKHAGKNLRRGSVSAMLFPHREKVLPPPLRHRLGPRHRVFPALPALCRMFPGKTGCNNRFEFTACTRERLGFGSRKDGLGTRLRQGGGLFRPGDDRTRPFRGSTWFVEWIRVVYRQNREGPGLFSVSRGGTDIAVRRPRCR